MLTKTMNIFKNSLIIFLFIFIVPLCSAQNWTEPVNISNMEGMDNNPDLAVDKNGTLHCVWIHNIEQNFSKVYYSKSINGGLTWSLPEDISLNDEKWLSDAHIACDTENNLHVTYDYEVGNPAQTMIYYKIFDGITWSEPIIVSENMQGSYKNQIAIDKNDRVYFFWYRAGLLGHIYSRYFENGIWSEITSPLDYYMVVVKLGCDSNNNLHCLAAHHGGQSDNNKYVYFKYDYASNVWSDTTEISSVTSSGADMDIDSNNYPHIAWCQMTPGTTFVNDSTMYRFYNGIEWTSPELIVEDPREQQIEIDENGNPNIFDTEKTAVGSMLVHHFKKDSIWQGYIIDESDYYGMSPVVENYNNTLLTAYVKPHLDHANGDIFFSKSDIIATANNIQTSKVCLDLYPNPFNQSLNISFKTDKAEKVSIKVFSLEGNLINILLEEQTLPGDYKFTWNGTDKSGKDVSPAVYLIRLQAGNYIVTKSALLAQ